MLTAILLTAGYFALIVLIIKAIGGASKNDNPNFAEWDENSYS